MLMKEKRIGNCFAFYSLLLTTLFCIIVIFATSCKDDDMGLKSPCMNHSDNNYYLSNLPEKIDSLYEIHEQPYHLWRLGIYSKETNESIGDVSFSNKNETEILDQ